jgi:hypothetical protein
MATQEVRSQVSEVSIANQALSWLAMQPITSLDDNDKTSQWMRINYPFLRDAVLEERNWTFATDRAQSTVADKDAWGTMFIHPIPISWQSVYRCYRRIGDGSANISGSGDRNNNITSDGWRVEGGNVLSYDDTVYMWGMKRLTDTGSFSSLFVQALAARIAADACVPFTENRELQRDLWDLYNGKLREAAARDGQQGGNDVIQSNTLIDARAGSGYGV